jgi:bifunctional non-homologous end joining protein LigD
MHWLFEPVDRKATLDPLVPAPAQPARARSAVLDREVVCLDGKGRRGSTRCWFVVTHLCLRGVRFGMARDARALPLVRRKTLLRRVVPRDAGCVLYADHVDRAGRALFALVCDCDLQGIAANWKHGPYAELSTWVKVKNPAYTGARDRHELMG